MDAKIDTIIERTYCKRHMAYEGEPCFEIHGETSLHNGFRGVCNTRARKAGFTGRIKRSSLVRTQVPRK